MENVRVVIVDDSPFAISLIRGILEGEGYNVVGEAGTLEEVIEIVKRVKPTLVTMDLTLPGTDGIECTREIYKIDPNIKVVFVSSMMDKELVEMAKKSNVSEYIQKPIDSDELLSAIERIVAEERLFKQLEEEYVIVFKEALLDSVNRMAKVLITFKNEYSMKKDLMSKGVSVVVGIIGAFSGRMLLDLSRDTAKNMAAAFLKREPKNNAEVIATIAEFANIISGNACSILNRKNKSYSLRIAPPSIVHGDDIYFSAPDFETNTVVADSELGIIRINIGFSRGEIKWM